MTDADCRNFLSDIMKIVISNSSLFGYYGETNGSLLPVLEWSHFTNEIIFLGTGDHCVEAH